MRENGAGLIPELVWPGAKAFFCNTDAVQETLALPNKIGHKNDIPEQSKAWKVKDHNSKTD